VVGAHRGQQAQGLVLAEEFGAAQAVLAGQRVVHLQAGAVERRIQQAVGRHHERQRLGQVRRVVQQRAALVQGFAHQGHIALGQVAHAAVHQLGGARGGALGEVVRLHQRHLEAAGRRIHGRAQARGSTADNQQIVGFRLGQAGQ